MSDTVTLLSAAKRKWEAGEGSEAERLWRSVLAADPSHAQAARLLGEMLLDARRHQDAYAVVSVAARKRPFDADLRNLMGRCFHAIGQIPAARTIFETVLQRDPTSVSAKIGTALCAAANRRAADALATLLPLLPSNQGNAYLHGALGQCYFSLAIPEDAVKHYQAAIRLRPAIGWRAECAWSLFLAKRVDEAMAEFDAVLAIDPRFEIAISGKAQALIERRSDDEARRILTDALDRGAFDDSLLIAHSRLARTSEQRAVSRRFLERRLTLTQGHSSRIPVLFALGRLKEADGEYDAAFACFRTANEQSGPPIPAKTIGESFRSVMNVFSKENLQRAPRNSKKDTLPVFIIGMPRSGTSLVEQILASHPDAYGAGELPDLNRMSIDLPTLMRPRSSASFPAAALSMNQGDVERMAGEYLERLRTKSGSAKVATDKMPWNFVYCGLIDMLFPGAKIIHCQRNPLDTCVSIYATSLSESHAYKNQLGNLAATYREYRKLMAHWRETLRVPIFDIRYEDVVGEPETYARRIVEYVGLPWDDRCLKFYENRRGVGTASSDQVRRPIYDTSINRWRNYEKHLGELIEGLRGVE